MCMFFWRFITICLVAGTLVSVATPTLTLAQSSCDVDQLSREETGSYRLAILVNGNWQFFDSNDREPEHILHLQKAANQNLCIAWEAPPYKGIKRQIVYASTQYQDDQPLWLIRNNVVAQVPIVGRLLGDWSRAPGTNGKDPDELFRKFHSSPPENFSGAPWISLAHWHDTSVWLTNKPSYELVSVTTVNSTFLPYGTERLLVLASGRPLTSWVPFTSHPPSPKDRLRVAVSYSGNLDVLGPKVYRYEFVVK